MTADKGILLFKGNAAGAKTVHSWQDRSRIVHQMGAILAGKRGAAQQNSGRKRGRAQVVLSAEGYSQA